MLIGSGRLDLQEAPSTLHYIALKIDVVRSRSVANRQQLQDRIFAVVADANDRFADQLVSQLTVTHGDEVQGLIAARHIRACLPLCEHFIDGLQPQRVRIGAGVGRLATKLQPTAIGMDGEAWYRAQAAIERARRTRAVFLLEGPEEAMEEDINAVLNFLLSHRLNWTANQREAVHLLRALGSQQAVASHLRISKAAVSKRLAGCMWDKYKALWETAQRQLQRYIAAINAR